jgi:adenylylsulfate kinase
MATIKSTNIHWHKGYLSREQRWNHLKTRGCTVWFTGLPASGKSTIASAFEKELVNGGRFAYRLDGDNVRHGLNSNLGFSREDRRENIRRIGEVAKLFAECGCIALTAFISPFIEDRVAVRRSHQMADLPFFEVFVDAPLEVCEQRDPKGQYKKARDGIIKGFTGIDAPYQTPPKPELVIKTDQLTIEQCVQVCIGLLSTNNMIAS